MHFVKAKGILSAKNGIKIAILPNIFSNIRVTDILLFIMSSRELNGIILIVRFIEPIAANKMFK